MRQADLKPGTESDIIIKTDFVTLTKADIYNYYQKNKGKILSFLQDRDAFIVIKIDDTIIKRNLDGNKITSKNWDEYNTGRTVEYHMVSKARDTIWWVDLDPKENFSFEKVKKVVEELVPLLKKELNPQVIHIKFSGGRGFHIWGHLKKEQDVNVTRNQLKDLLDEYAEDKEKLSTGVVKEPDEMRLDVSTLKTNGSIRVPYSLHATTGLISLPLSIDELKTFKKENAKILKKSKLFAFEKTKNKESEITKLVATYKKDMNWIQKDFDEIPELLDDFVAVSLKLDGELVGIYFDGDDTKTYSKGGIVRWDIPVLEEITKILKDKGFSKATFFGELYAVDSNEKPLSYLKAQHILQKPNAEEEKQIRVIVYNIYSLDDKKYTVANYIEEFKEIERIFSNGKLVRPAKTSMSVDDIDDFWDVVEKGEAEGLVLRTTKRLVKVKPEFTSDVMVMFVQKATDHDYMGSLGVAYMDKDKNILFGGKVGTGFKQSEREEWYKWGKESFVYKENNKFFINPKDTRIVEIKVEQYSVRQAPAYKWSGKKYEEIGTMESAVSRKPVFKRIREDKEAIPSDIRITQVSEFAKAEKQARFIKTDLLEEYREKRDFEKTPEPEGSKVEKRKSGRLIGLALHSAEKAGIHGDLRLEHEGVLQSWAVPKIEEFLSGSKDKVLAVETEPHPIEYLTKMPNKYSIPEGEYGAGDVELYDKAQYDELVRTKDKITFKPNLKGFKDETWYLIRTRGKQWLLGRKKEKEGLYYKQNWLLKTSIFSENQDEQESAALLDIIIKSTQGVNVVSELGEWVLVDSSNLDAIRYDPENEELQVKFLSGAVYKYDNVPAEVVEDLLNADSKGSFFYWNIRNDYMYDRVARNLE